MTAPVDESTEWKRYGIITLGVIALPVAILLVLGRDQLNIDYSRAGLALLVNVCVVWLLCRLEKKLDIWRPEPAIELAFWIVIYGAAVAFATWSFTGKAWIMLSVWWGLCFVGIRHPGRNVQITKQSVTYSSLLHTAYLFKLSPHRHS